MNPNTKMLNQIKPVSFSHLPLKKKRKKKKPRNQILGIKITKKTKRKESPLPMGDEKQRNPKKNSGMTNSHVYIYRTKKGKALFHH